MPSLAEFKERFFKTNTSPEKTTQKNRAVLLAEHEMAMRGATHTDEAHHHRSLLLEELFKEYGLRREQAGDIARQEMGAWQSITLEEKLARYIFMGEKIKAGTGLKFNIVNVAYLHLFVDEKKFKSGEPMPEEFILDCLAEIYQLIFNLTPEQTQEVTKALRHYSNAVRHERSKRAIKDDESMEDLFGSEECLEEMMRKEYTTFYTKLLPIIQKNKTVAAAAA